MLIVPDRPVVKMEKRKFVPKLGRVLKLHLHIIAELMQNVLPVVSVIINPPVVVTTGQIMTTITITTTIITITTTIITITTIIIVVPL